MKILTIIQKNVKFLMHHRLSAAIVILGPLILILLAGIAFSSSNLHGIKIGVVEEGYKEDSIMDIFVSQIDSEDYKVVKFKTIEECSDKLKKKKLHMCVEFVENEKNMRFHVDPSRYNLVWIILNMVSSKMNTATDDLRYVTTNMFIDTMSEVSKVLENNKDKINNIIKSTGDLERGLGSVSNGIMVLEMGFDVNSFDLKDVKNKAIQNNHKIAEFQGTINDEIYSSIDKLDDFEYKARQLQEEIARKKEERRAIDIELNASYAYFECTDSESVDLSMYVDDPDEFLNIMKGLEKPECSYVYTIRKNIDKCTGDLDRASREVGVIVSNISSAKRGLEDLNEQSDTLFYSAKRDLDVTINEINNTEKNLEQVKSKISDLEKKKTEIHDAIRKMQSEINNSYYYLITFNGSISELSGQMKSMSNISADRIVRPVINTVEGFDEEKTQIDYFFPVLIVFIICFVSILLGNILTTREKMSRAFFRNLISPTKDMMLLLGSYLTTLGIVVMQIILVILVSKLFISLKIKIFSPEILIMLLIAISIFTFIGIILGNMMESEETSTVFSIIIAILMLIFSGSLLPMESMPSYLHIFVQINPFYLVQNILSMGMVYGVSLSSDIKVLSLLAIYFIGLAFISFISFEYAKKQVKG